MTSKTLTTIALLSSIVACGGEQKTEDRASFADADSEEIVLTMIPGTGMDAMMSGMMLLAVDDAGPCFTVTEVEGGLQYEGADNPSCSSSMKGTITVYGVDGPGWTMESGERTVHYDNVEFPPEFDGDDAYFLDGTVDSGPTYLEADLKSNFLGRMVQSHTRMSIDPDTGYLTHGSDSWASIPGLGSFDISGFFSFESGEGELEFSGQDTLTLTGKTDCLRFEIDGELWVPEKNSGEFPICED